MQVGGCLCEALCPVARSPDQGHPGFSTTNHWTAEPQQEPLIDGVVTSMRTEYLPGCLIGNIIPAATMGSVFTVLNVVQGAPLTPQLAAVNVGFLYAYSALQCPMEALTGRRSWVHNLIAGGTLGYVAFERGITGIPFNLESTFLMRRVPLSLAAAIVYGGMGATLAIVQGKPL